MNIKGNFTGALVEVDPETGRINDVFLMAADEKSAAVIFGAMARVMARQHWGWIRRLIGKSFYGFKKRGL